MILLPFKITRFATFFILQNNFGDFYGLIYRFTHIINS